MWIWNNILFLLPHSPVGTDIHSEKQQQAGCSGKVMGCAFQGAVMWGSMTLKQLLFALKLYVGRAAQREPAFADVSIHPVFPCSWYDMHPKLNFLMSTI